MKTEDEIPRPYEDEGTANADSDHLELESVQDSGGFDDKDYGDKKDEYVHVGFQGVHVKDKNGEVHVGWDGIHVDDRNKGDNVHIDKNGVYVNGEKYDKEWFSHHAHFPVFFLILVVYFIIGCVWGAWHPGWLLFFLVPIWHSLVDSIEKKNANHFAYPVLAVLIFLCLGFFGFMWHPGWVVFLTIPLYYSLVSYIHALKKRRHAEYEYFDGEEQFRTDDVEGLGDADEK